MEPLSSVPILIVESVIGGHLEALCKAYGIENVTLCTDVPSAEAHLNTKYAGGTLCSTIVSGEEGAGLKFTREVRANQVTEPVILMGGRDIKDFSALEAEAAQHANTTVANKSEFFLTLDQFMPFKERLDATPEGDAGNAERKKIAAEMRLEAVENFALLLANVAKVTGTEFDPETAIPAARAILQQAVTAASGGTLEGEEKRYAPKNAMVEGGMPLARGVKPRYAPPPRGMVP